jgi:hypothetical protein
VKTQRIIDVFRREYKVNGYKYFFRGITPTIIRAFPVNAIILTSFDYTSKYFDCEI